MKKIAATIIKEWQLMVRDIPGILILLGMPAAMIIIMALIQDAPFKDYQELSFDLLIADNDHGSLARQITQGLKNSKNFKVTDSLDGTPVTEARLKQLLNDGKYKIGIVLPAGVTAEVVNAANIVVNDISEKTGLAIKLPAREAREKMYVSVFFDPVSKPAFRTAINSALEKFISFSSTGILIQRLASLNREPGTNTDSANVANLKRIMQGIGIKEEPLNDSGKMGLHINSVQHNVPAWAIFGMFFIIIPISGHVIKEREDGSALRISLIPNSGRYVAFGKILFYTLICSLQFLLMLCIGLWVMPLLGLPALYPGLHAWVLLPVSLFIGFAATSFGLFIGTAFKTITQALPFGSLAIVILSALGGIWVPVEILPHSMKTIALASPLYWSLEAVNEVILRNGGIGSVLLPLLILLVTGLFFCVAGMLIKNRNV
jgi:ABC-2 type transport system permease protein